MVRIVLGWGEQLGSFIHSKMKIFGVGRQWWNRTRMFPEVDTMSIHLMILCLMIFHLTMSRLIPVCLRLGPGPGHLFAFTCILVLT